MTAETSADAAGGSPQAEPAALNHEICALLSDALWLGSPDLADIEYVNPAFENLWGRAAQEVYESPQLLIDGVHPDDRERLLTVMSEQQKDWTADFRVVRPDGSERRVEVCGFSQDGGPDAEAQGGLCRDVSDRFETQASVMKSEA